MKRYHAKSIGMVFVTDDRGTRQLDPRLDLKNHSPTGFSWGFSGSGPAQLSLAILCDALGDDRRALAIYQQFKEAAIAPIHVDGAFALTEAAVLEQASAIEKEAA